MSERNDAFALADRILDRPNADPDDDLSVLARQLLRRTEELEAYRDACRRAGVCMTCVVRAPEPYGCTDCLNTGWDGGAGPRARDEIMRLMREDFDPHPNWELPAGAWDDNAEDVADKIIAAALSEKPTHVSDAWRIVRAWLAALAEEEAAFSRYQDDALLDGVMTVAEARRLIAALPTSEPK